MSRVLPPRFARLRQVGWLQLNTSDFSRAPVFLSTPTSQRPTIDPALFPTIEVSLRLFQDLKAKAFQLRLLEHARRPPRPYLFGQSLARGRAERPRRSGGVHPDIAVQRRIVPVGLEHPSRRLSSTTTRGSAQPAKRLGWRRSDLRNTK
jgi:hypothetical protein